MLAGIVASYTQVWSGREAAVQRQRARRRRGVQRQPDFCSSEAGSCCTHGHLHVAQTSQVQTRKRRRGISHLDFRPSIGHVTDGVTGEISPKGAREGTHRPFPNCKITWPPNHNNKRFNVSARSDARRPTDGQLVAQLAAPW